MHVKDVCVVCTQLKTRRPLAKILLVINALFYISFPFVNFFRLIFFIFFFLFDQQAFKSSCKQFLAHNRFWRISLQFKILLHFIFNTLYILHVLTYFRNFKRQKSHKVFTFLVLICNILSVQFIFCIKSNVSHRGEQKSKSFDQIRDTFQSKFHMNYINNLIK